MKVTRDGLALGFTLVFPTVFTWLYFVVLSDVAPWLQQSVYAVGKLVQFGFPVAWVWLVCRERLAWPERPWAGLPLGIGVGLAIVAAMLLLHGAWLQPSGLLDAPAEAVRQRVISAGIDSQSKYAALAVFYSGMHSLLEEYYWRWFVFSRLTRCLSVWPAIGISSFGFMAHHVVVLSQYFGWGSFLSLFFSFSVAVGGVVWAGLYHRYRTLLAPWSSHVLVDAGIFWLGYMMLRSAW